MSIATAGRTDPDIIYKKPMHHFRKESGEIDVFEAASYFSGYNEACGVYNYATYNTQAMRVERGPWRIQRMSLDMPVRDILPRESYQLQKPKKDKKHKPPSSPGGKLASFLNSLFNQGALKKKKSKSMKDEEEIPGGKKWRRSSISHFGNTTHANSKSIIYPSSNSGFRTPPPFNYNPINGYKDFGSCSDHKQVAPYSKYNGFVKTTILQNDDKRKKDTAWSDEKFRFNHGLMTQGSKINGGNNNFLEKENSKAEKYTPKIKEIMKFDDVDDGAESDSSADLFELQNYDIGSCPGGLPVYETTNLNNVKK